MSTSWRIHGLASSAGASASPRTGPASSRRRRRLDKALEIDASPDRQDLNVELLRIARDAGVRISIGTDAHQPAELAFMEFGLAAAILADIPKERILNFASREDVLAWTRGER